MSTHQQAHDALVGIHFRKYPETDPNIFGNPLLVDELGKLGVGSVLIPGSTAYDTENGSVRAHALRLEDGERDAASLSVGDPRELALGADGVAAIRARVALNRQIESLTPVVNDLALRRIGGDKWEQYVIASDVMPRTVSISPDTVSIEQETLLSFNGSKVVIKRVAGGDGNWVRVVDKRPEAVNDALQELRSKMSSAAAKNKQFKQGMILQEYCPAARLDGMVPADEASAARYETTGKDGHELRFFTFITNDGLYRQRAVLRAFDGNTNEWIMIDQDHLPAAAAMLAETISRRVLAASGSPGGLIAVDVYRPDASLKTTQGWMLREVNTKDPQLVTPEESVHEARAERKDLAILLHRLSKSSAGKV